MEISEKAAIPIVLLCGLSWGAGGVIGQLMFEHTDITVAYLCCIRMFLAGLALLFMNITKNPRQVVSIFPALKNVKTAASFAIFTIFGIASLSYTYFAAIHESNAATATVLQYTYPIFVLIFSAIQFKKIPRIEEIAAIFLAFTGIVLIATHGNLQNLTLSKAAIFWGIMAALAFVAYTVLPQKLFQRFSIEQTNGWAFIIGSFLLAFVTKPWNQQITISPLMIILMLSVTFLGSILPFLLYGAAIQKIGSVKASLFVTVEPVCSAILTTAMGLASFMPIDLAGFACILIPIEIIAIRSRRIAAINAMKQKQPSNTQFNSQAGEDALQ